MIFFSDNLLVSRVRALLDDPTEDIIITDDEDIQVINEDINVKIVKVTIKVAMLIISSLS